MIDFPKVFWDFQKWTFIFVHFLLSEKGFGTKNHIFARFLRVGTLGPITREYNIFVKALKENTRALSFNGDVWTCDVY
jgi:hypothetical protein